MRRLGPAGLVVCACAAVAIPSAGASGGGSAPAVGAPAEWGRTGNLIAFIRTPDVGSQTGAEKRDAVRARIATVLERTGLPKVRSMPEIGAVAVRPAADQSLPQAGRGLERDPAVRSVEAELYRTLRFLPNDPALVVHDSHAPGNDFYQWNLRKERFSKAWKRARGRGAKLAIIDTGMDGGHFDLHRRIGRAVNQTGNNDCGTPVIEPPCTGPRTDDVGHGTHVAGLACGQGRNHRGLAGAAFACKLIDEKASHTVILEDSAIVDSIDDATNHGADVISMSFGGGPSSSAINHALDRAFRHDVILVAAASNEDTTHQGSPASHLQPNGTGDNIRKGKGLVVTAAQHNGHRAWFNPGHGSGISLAAYGAASSQCAFRTDCGIFSTFPDNPNAIEDGDPFNGEPPCGMCRTTFRGSDDFAYLEGTSMATPQVAGAAALIRSVRPHMSNRKVMRIIKRTANHRHFRGTLGWGILNAGLAVRRAAR